MNGQLNLIEQSGGKIFSARFVKKDRTIRDMIARTGVRKNLKGTGMSWTPSDKNMEIVYDMRKKAYRMINLSTLLSFRCGNIVWER